MNSVETKSSIYYRERDRDRNRGLGFPESSENRSFVFPFNKPSYLPLNNSNSVYRQSNPINVFESNNREQKREDQKSRQINVENQINADLLDKRINVVNQRKQNQKQQHLNQKKQGGFSFRIETGGDGEDDSESNDNDHDLKETEIEEESEKDGGVLPPYKKELRKEIKTNQNQNNGLVNSAQQQLSLSNTELALLIQDMSKEEYATWFATVIIVGVLGTEFSGRLMLGSLNRKLIDGITLTIAIYMLIWATLSRFHVIDTVRSDQMLISVVVLVILLLVTFIVGTASEEFG